MGWWASGLVRQWEWGLGAGDSGMGVVSGTVGQCGSGGWGIVAHEGDVAYNDDRQ